MIETADFRISGLYELDTLGPVIIASARDMIREGKTAHIRVEEISEKRSLSQNDMHCGLCREIAAALKERTGLDYDVEYMRAKTKRKFGVVMTQPDPATGKPEPYLLSTTKYTKSQFSKLIDGTLAWAYTDLRISVSDPRAGNGP